jgi:hypothetical protein
MDQAASCEGRLQWLEPYEAKVSSTVLRGEGDGNVVLLPDRLRADI